ncbi:MAG: zinc finger domain-containing protein, partial [Sphingomonas sp.]
FAQIAKEKAAIAAGGPVPADWKPNQNKMTPSRLRAWNRPCPKCGAEAKRSCAGKTAGTVRWSFHRARLSPPNTAT